MHVEIRIFFGVLLGVSLLLAAACTSAPGEPTALLATLPPRVESSTPTSTAAPTLTPTPYPWQDASAVMSDLCFESVADAAGRTFVIRSAAELEHFFDLADNSHLCRHPVQRGTFDFSGDTFLIGLWSKTTGCTAHHDVISVRRDDVAQTYVIRLRLVAEGACGYELVRPFWIAVGGLAGYDVRLLVQ